MQQSFLDDGEEERKEVTEIKATHNRRIDYLHTFLNGALSIRS